MRILFALAMFFNITDALLANDGVTGTDRYEADFASKNTQYKLTEDDRQWAASMKRKLKQTGVTVFFVRTDLPLVKNGKELHGLIYQRVDLPELYFVPDGNALLNTQKDHVWTFYTSRGDIRWPKARNFIVFFDVPDGGYAYTEHSKIEFGKVWWLADGSYQLFR